MHSGTNLSCISRSARRNARDSHAAGLPNTERGFNRGGSPGTSPFAGKYESYGEAREVLGEEASAWAGSFGAGSH